MKRLNARETAAQLGAPLTLDPSGQLARDIARVARMLGRNTERLRVARLRVTQLENLVREDKRRLLLLARGRFES
jgi:hypothetical protein